MAFRVPCEVPGKGKHLEKQYEKFNGKVKGECEAMERTRISMNRRMRYMCCGAFFALSLLLLGAEKLSEGMQNRNRESENRRRDCRMALQIFLDAVPAEHRAAWTDLAESSPELCFRANHSCLNLISR